MKVQVLDSLVGEDELGKYSYGKGLHENVPESRAKQLIKAGLALLVDVLIEAATDRIVKANAKRK